jgi:hypothetical protein
MKIYIGRNGQQQGPYSIEELNKLALSEPITGNDMCWHEGCADWIPLSQFPGFIASLPPSPTSVPQASASTQVSANNTLYYLLLNNEQAGPYTAEQLRSMWQNGVANAQTQYCFAGGASWQPLIHLRTMLEPVPGQPTPVLPSPPKASSSPSGFMGDLRAHPLGGIMLAVAALGTVFSWCAESNFELGIAIAIAVICITAILGGIEASQLGIGSDTDRTAKGKRKYTPRNWGAFILGLWIVGFPAYLYRRSRYGAHNLLLPAVIVSLLFLAVPFLASPTLPAVDAPEVVQLAEQIIRGSPAIKVSGGLIGSIAISNPGEISYDKQHQKRVARAELKTNLGSEVIYYTVEWQNRSKGIIWVQIQAHP